MSTASGAGAAAWHGRQYHYLSSESHVHPFLVDLWDDVREASAGRLDITVHSANEGLTRTHLGIVQQLIEGEIEFYLSMGGVLATLAPAMAVHDLPFVFATATQAHNAFDGPLGDHLRGELEKHGIVALPGGVLENGFRHLATVNKPVAAVEDLAGLRVRVPEAPVIEHAFRALGAEPVHCYVVELPDALAEGRVDAQEFPLAVAEALGLHKLTPHLALTAHAWCGFHIIAGRAFWDGLPDDLRAIVLAAIPRHVARQRAHAEALNHEVESRLAGQGLDVRTPAREAFRDRLAASGFYAAWEKTIGRRAWSLLEQTVGELA